MYVYIYKYIYMYAIMYVTLCLPTQSKSCFHVYN